MEVDRGPDVRVLATGATLDADPIIRPVTTLLERERELRRLTARLEEARAGEGALVVVEGPPGIGKTSVLRSAARSAAELGFEVLRARGAEVEREWPFGAARQLLEPALRSRDDQRARCRARGAARLAAPVLLPESDEGATTVDASYGTLHGLYWICANLAAEHPPLLIVDDAQWVDEASLRFLGVLARRLDVFGVLAVVGQRPAPARWLAELVADPQTERLSLRLLSAVAPVRCSRPGRRTAWWRPASRSRASGLRAATRCCSAGSPQNCVNRAWRSRRPTPPE